MSNIAFVFTLTLNASLVYVPLHQNGSLGRVLDSPEHLDRLDPTDVPLLLNLDNDSRVLRIANFVP